MSKGTVLVTGASGFCGSSIVEQLLQAGYSVKGTARSSKAALLRKLCPNPKFEVVVVDDLIAGDFSEALRGVNAVIHTASPMPGTVSNPVEVARGGTLNLIQQAYKAKVYKITVISSYVTLLSGNHELWDDKRVFNDKSWRPVKDADLLPDAPPFDSYSASKVLAELAAWEFAEAHPEVDLITLLPAYIYGPFPPYLVITDAASLSTNYWITKALSGVYPENFTGHNIDVRDVGKACVLSLTATKREPGERRRIILTNGTFSWAEGIKHIASVKPELKSRLLDGGNPPPAEEDSKPKSKFDTSLAKDVLGLYPFISWKQSLEESVDSILEKEKSWSFLN